MTYYVSIGTLNLTKPNQRDQTACAILSLSCWKLNNLFFNNPAFINLRISSRSSTVRGVMFTYQSDVAHNMYPIPVVYQKIFNELTQILH